ncbi:MAG: hypothetical protein H6707_13940 [Deltaproteobacteria bacterium]|nr:hypothetical protein [Deltaproteobacteria bacterium]
MLGRRSIWCMLGCLLSAACGGADGDLSGTAARDYDLSYSTVRVQQQLAAGAPVAMLVLYERGGQNDRETPVKLVANWPVEVGKSVDLVKGGALIHVVAGGAQFPDLIAPSSATFQQFGQPGEPASGEFSATFVGGTTLNGKFSAQLEVIGQ